ncbi:uncharacterized protein LOC135211541 [Macrobrachium nipponense]|uniref:uncharacterized protein LOC135211541 n=1 Tax=Macrobrachium nipponense TaxID=159736 RepID=UPI0030C7BA8C
MASFDVDKFAGNPSAELSTIQCAKKKDLLELGLRLRLPVRSNLKKSEIRNLILEHYLKAKEAVIDAFSISVEGYRQVFRNKVKTSTQTYLEFASEKLRDFRKWLKASAITTFERLENIIVFEEFVRKLPSHIMLYLCDRQENDLLKAASLADTYSLVHKTSKRLDHIVKQVPGNTLGVSTEESREALLCKYCKKPGHSIKNCKAPNCKVSELNRNFKDRSFKSNPVHRDKPSLHVVTHEAVDLFEGFKIDGIGSLTSDGAEHKLKMLRNLVVPNLVVTDHPSEGNDFSNDVACVITRSQKSKDLECSEVVENAVENIMSKAELIKAQKQDDTLSNFHSQAVSKSEIDKSPSFYYESGVLMRFYRPAKLSKLDTWGEKHQIVLPSSVRKLVLEVAHDGGRDGGHLGIHKTYHKILNHFYWPNMKKDIADFIRTCHICQISGKPNQSIPKYPLQPIVVPDDPFHRVIIDCVGPLPKTKKGHQYLLTIMCPTTRYPIAIPLRNILAKTIANALLKVFTTYGSSELQCDRGSNFTSDLFSKVLKELEIKQILSSAYHPESQGVLERWHQTFKKNTSATANSIDDLIPSWSPESNSEVLQNLELKLSHLPSEHSQRLQTLIDNVSFCDFPRKSTVLLHDIELVPGTMPIRQLPYRLSPDRKAQMKREVEYLLKHGLSVPSKSPWASPCLLVPKEDGNLRFWFCTDYRKLNMVTIKDHIHYQE